MFLTVLSLFELSLRIALLSIPCYRHGWARRALQEYGGEDNFMRFQPGYL